MCKVHLLQKALAIAAFTVCSVGGFAQTQISDEAGLKAIANDLTGSYVLTQDITLKSEWSPLGTEEVPFTGTLDGQGHTIKGLYIGSRADNVGLFSYTNGATLQNVRLAGVRVYGNKQVGALAAQAIATSIDKVFVSGLVYGYDHVGGVVGDARGNVDEGTFTTISNCATSVFAYSTNYQAGGIAGWTNAGVFTNNIAYGSSHAPASWSGAAGIVPLLDGGSATIDGNVSAAYKVTGYADPDATNDDGTAAPVYHLHGILGWVNNSGTVSMSNNLSLASTVYLYDNGNKTIADHSVLAGDLQGTETSADALKQAATYTAIGFDPTIWTLDGGQYPVLKGMTYPIDGDAICVAPMPETIAQGGKYESGALDVFDRKVTITSSDPSIVSVDGTTINFVGVGTATVTYTTEGDAFCAGTTLEQTFTVTAQNYNITTATDLLNIKNNLAGDYTLANDIDMTGVEFTPLGELTGSLDGQGHVIKGLTFNNPQQDQAALFSTMRGGTIKNLGLENANIVGNANTAAIVGRMYGGTVENCYVANSYIEGRDHVASITGDLNRDGDNGGTIKNCLANAVIKSRSYQAGGLIGVANGGTLENCLFSGTVDNSGGVAGLCSLIDNNDWETYPTTFTHNVSAPAHLIGGGSFPEERMIHLAGRGANLKSNYALNTTTYDQAGAMFNTEAGNADELIGASVDEATLRTKDFYVNTLGWDFDNTWKFIEGTEGYMYPVLSWMKAPLNTQIFNLPVEASLLYSDGSENIGVEGIHGSWGQGLTFEVTKGQNLVTYVEEEKKIYIGDEEGYYTGSGDATVKVSNVEALASVLTTTGTDEFNIYVDKKGSITKITTAEEFINIKKNPAGDYELMNDIDMSGVEFTGIACEGTPFSGTLNGNNHKVKNIKVEFSSGSDLGVFGSTAGAKISNIAFENIYVNGPNVNHIGLIGTASSTQLDNVAVTGTVYGNDHVGLLAGDGDGVTMNNCYVWGKVEGYSQVGGLFGCTLTDGATIKNSYTNGSFTCTTRGWAGGFIGLIDKANSTVTITNSVSLGNCASIGSGSSHAAAPFIAGNSAGDTPNATIFFKDNLYNTQATMHTEGDVVEAWPNKNETVEGGEVVPAEGKNATDLQQVGNYTNIGWDFDSTWAITGENGYNYPVLKGIGYVDYTEGDPTGISSVSNETKSLNGAVYTIDGRQVRSAGQGLKGLQKGVYIVDGHKVVIR